MLERQHLTVKEYNKDQKAYASMLNKMYVAAKEGELELMPTVNLDSGPHFLLGYQHSSPMRNVERTREKCVN